MTTRLQTRCMSAGRILLSFLPVPIALEKLAMHSVIIEDKTVIGGS